MKLQDKYTILIVDDHLLSLQVIKNQLQAICNATILSASSKNEAIYQIQSMRPNLIFMDIAMKECSANDMLGLLKSFYPSSNEFFILGLGSTTLEEKNQDCYCNVLLKPLSLEVIRRCLMTYLPDMDIIRQQKSQELNTISTYFKSVQGMDLKTTLEYTQCNKEQFIPMIETSLHQIKIALQQLNQEYKKSNAYELYQILHGIKMVFYYLGNKFLGEKTQEIELYYKNKYLENWEENKEFFEYLRTIEAFYNELKQANDAYISSIPNINLSFETQRMSTEQYLKKINEIVNLCNDYEYLEIIKEIKGLRLLAPKEDLAEIEKALHAVFEFNYDKVNDVLDSIKKKMKIRNV